MGQRIAHRGAVNILDPRHHVAHLSGLQFIALDPLGGKDADAVNLVGLADGFRHDLVAFAQHAVLDPHQRDHPEVVVEPGVDDQRLQRGLAVALGRRDFLHQVFQRILHAQARFGAHQAGIGGVDADNLLYLFLDLVGVRLGEVHLVEDGQHFQTLLYGGIAVGDRLGLDALAGVHDQQRALTGRQGARYLIGKIDVAGGVDKIQLEHLAAAGLVVEGDALGLDGDTALALDIHGVQHLLVHLPVAEPATVLYEAVSQRGLAMVYMGNNGEIADVAEFTHSNGPGWRGRWPPAVCTEEATGQAFPARQIKNARL